MLPNKSLRAFSASASHIGLCFLHQNASSACAIASSPLAAVTKGGTVSVSSGSTIAAVAKNAGEVSGFFAPRAASLITDTPVTSLPVPAVAGIAMTGSASSGNVP